MVTYSQRKDRFSGEAALGQCVLDPLVLYGLKRRQRSQRDRALVDIVRRLLQGISLW